ncbi:MAG TPA: glycosyltransferase family 39 protein [Phycisphaerales bacterium]|nr:glycosyltransferase family 39 protein [Phycisphaerales bacterium]HMP36539.1 glycosyltransferase family 39 protein [Phycisphaerales bacterium]
MPRDAERRLIVATLLMVLAVLLGRMLAPSDLWDQAQPRTVAYTADIIAHGGASWILPRDADGLGATKPPLYNWIAVPFVVLIGRPVELAHRAPSILAMLGTLAVTIAIGRRLGRGVGWLAALMLVASYPIFKLGTIARPDMPLVFFLVVGFASSTRLLTRGAGCSATAGASGSAVAPARLVALRAAFWGALVAAAWTKGPAAILLLLHALVAARLARGEFRAVSAIGLWWALPALAVAAAWPLGVWIVDARHLVEQLWREEFAGRVAGTGTEGGGRGPLGILLGMPSMPAYFVVRFVPWSILAIVAIAALVKAPRPARRDPERILLISSAVWIGVVLLLFSLSSGKRADYIAPAFPPAALLAAWWLVDSTGIRRRPGAVIAVAAGAVATMLLAAWTLSPLDRGGAAALQEAQRRARCEHDRLLREGLAGQVALLAIQTPLEQLPATIGTGRPMDSAVEQALRLLESGRPMLLLYDRTTIPALLAARLDEAERTGLGEERWSIDIPWKERVGVARRNLTCVAISAPP